MSFKIFRTPEFSKHLKQLSKKYPSIKKDYETLLFALSHEPLQGQPLVQNCFKIRWNITFKKSGKRGGARVITFVKIEAETITLLDVYDKSEKDTLSPKELQSLLKQTSGNV